MYGVLDVPEGRKGQEDEYCDKGLGIKSFIWKKNAFRGKVTLEFGRSNHCSVKGDSVFHLFIDCDNIRLSKLLDRITLLRKKFPELAKVKFVILSTSPSHFSVASFVRLTWKKYLKILWYAVDIGMEHEGHAVYTTGKGYAVLRTGAKDGIVPRAMCETGEKTVCKTCKKEFLDSIMDAM